MVHYTGIRAREKKNINKMYVFMYVDAHEIRQKKREGQKILSLYHNKVAFLMYERGFFVGVYGRAMGITFLGKSEHMRYINFGKFYIEDKTKKILKIFPNAFFISQKKKEKWLFGGVASYPKLLRTAFF